MLTLEERQQIGNRIKEARKEKHITQKQCAQKLGGVTVQMISGWERGDVVPQLDNLIKISKLYDLTLDYIITGVNQENKGMKIETYKDVFKHMLALEDANIFNFVADHSGFGNAKDVTTYTFNQTVVKFVMELTTLKKAANILEREMLNQAINKLLENYDYPIKNDKSN